MSKPQVLVQVTGGIAYPTVTAGEVDVLQIDWDLFDDNLPTEEEIAEVQATISAIADDTERAGCQGALDEEIEKIETWAEADRLLDEDRRQAALAAAHKLIAEEEARASA